MAKRSGRMFLRQNAPRNKNWKFFFVEIVALFLLLLKSPFGQALHQTAANSMVERNFTTVNKKNNRYRHNTQYGGKQNNNWSSGVSGKQSSGSKTRFTVQMLTFS